MSVSETRKGIAIFAIVCLATLAAAILLGEWYLAAADKPSDYVWGWKYQGVRKNETNELGFRGREFRYGKSDYVVLIVGDSQVESEFGAFEKMPERRLQYHLSATTGKRIKVFSLGAGGYGQDQQLLALEEYFRKYTADLVVAWETPGNDVWNNMFPTHWPADGTPKPTFWLEEDESLHGPKVSLSSFRILDLVERVLLKRSLDEMWEDRYLPPAGEPATSYTGKYLVDNKLLANMEENLKNEKTHVLLSLVPVSDRARYGLRLTRELLSEMQRVTNSNGARFIAFADDRPDFPLPDGVYKVDRGAEVLYPTLSKKQYWDNVNAMNEGIDFFVVPVTTKNFTYKFDPHLNERAINRLMRDTANVLVEKIDDLGIKTN